MEFGLFSYWSPLKGASEPEAFTENFKEVAAAEDMGWDYVWLAAGTFQAGTTMDGSPLVLAAAVAARTHRIKIGSGVHLPRLKLPGEIFGAQLRSFQGGAISQNFRYAFDSMTPADPFQTAEHVATIDQVSQGRFIYGAGGYTGGDDERRNQFFEFLEVMKKLWTEEQFSGYQGKYYNYPPLPKGAGITPRPYQKPHPPILLPVDSQQSFVPMGRAGYRIATGGGTAHNQRGETVLKEDVRKYRQAWKDAGHPGNPTIAIRIPTHVADTKEAVMRDTEVMMEAAKARAARSAALNVAATIPGTPSLASTEKLNLFGTPDEVVARIQSFQEEFGADEVMFENNMAYVLPPDRVRRSMQLITDKVIPKFK